MVKSPKFKFDEIVIDDTTDEIGRVSGLIVQNVDPVYRYDIGERDDVYIAESGISLHTQVGEGGGGGGGEPTITTIVRIDLGQSNRMGLKAADQTKIQYYGNTMYVSGVGSWITDVQGGTNVRTSHAPLIEKNNYETGTAFGLNRMIDLHVADEGVAWDELGFSYFGTNSAVSGKSISQLGSTEWSRTVDDIEGIYPLFGTAAGIKWISFIQGFSDSGSTVATYLSDLSGYISAVRAKIAETYASAIPKVLISQHSIQRFTGGQLLPSPSLGQLEYADNDANVEIASPLYQCDWRDDGVHMSWQGQQMMEGFLTQTMFEIDKGTWNGPVRMGSIASWIGLEIVVNLIGGTGSYVLDESHIGVVPNNGFDIHNDDDTTLEDIITNVEIVGTQVVITLSVPSTPTAQLTYGWGRMGMVHTNYTPIKLGNLRDTGRGATTVVNTVTINLDNYAIISTLPK